MVWDTLSSRGSRPWLYRFVPMGLGDRAREGRQVSQTKLAIFVALARMLLGSEPVRARRWPGSPLQVGHLGRCLPGASWRLNPLRIEDGQFSAGGWPSWAQLGNSPGGGFGNCREASLAMLIVDLGCTEAAPRVRTTLSEKTPPPMHTIAAELRPALAWRERRRLAARRAGDVSPLFSPPIAKAAIGTEYGAYGVQRWSRIEPGFSLSCVAAAEYSQAARAPGGQGILNPIAPSGAKGNLPRLSSRWDLRQRNHCHP